MRKLSYTYLKPQNYYNRLFTFFLIVAITLTITLAGFSLANIESFILKFVVISFLLLVFAVLIEFTQVGDYMTPLEIFDIESFANKFLYDVKLRNIDYDFYFLKYTPNVVKKFDFFTEKANSLVLSSIKKKDETYTLTFIDVNKMAAFHIAHFLAIKSLKRIHIKRYGSSYKIVHID